jgi:cytochrome P450
MKPKRVLAVDDIDLSDLEFWKRPIDEREGAFATLRDERPVSFHEEPDLQIIPKGPGYWALTHHRDILLASRSPEVFCSGKGSSIADLPEPFLDFFGSMINMDDPQHARLRRIVSRGFTPGKLGSLDANVRAAAAQIIDTVIEKGECDFVTEIAAALPLRIICEMMGIPESQHEFVFDRTNIILGAGDPEYVPDISLAIPALLTAGSELNQLFTELAEQRRTAPSGDLTSALVNAELEGERLSAQELASFFILLVVAGNETTRNAISHGMLALCEHPEERAAWQANFADLAPTAIEEIVRWATPVIHFRRTATRDTEIGGQKIAAGEKLVLFYSSANRDERAFPEPFRFDIGRTPNEHVGFGGPGPHYCLGAHLARREITIMFRQILTRLPDLEITGEPDRLVSNFIHGIKHMTCTFTPSAPR